MDIFIAHNSPAGIHERDDHVHQGFDAFLKYIETSRPRYFLHGHQHLRQTTMIGDTRVIGVLGEEVIEVEYPPLAMPKISQEDYEPMKAFFIAWMERFPISIQPPPGHQPIDILKKLEEMGMAKARLGLGQAIGDTLEQALYLPASEIESIDRDFSARDIITLSQLLAKYSRKPRRTGDTY
ncbi:hypothetical protein OKA04_17470 [Luteolibacter flavescens]|uniref:Calcineurin-like phosphoesterase domain-containing protein n=1 Tax=Luteolibacter flavescens TaxID=1859460 RepID=A0ABT3FSK2_9BACT|nr:hypothetical protein [Luteolibacter flavescens]MCW1886532.1 hypothetical protein [Luteolibacter flavescens]